MTLSSHCVPAARRPNHPDMWRHLLPEPDKAAHKYQRGHAAVVGGSTMTGAARLAAVAALRSGAGLVTLLCEPDVWPVYAAALTSVIALPMDEAGLAPHLADERINVWLLGPGLGNQPRTRAMVEQVMAAKRMAVLDADALNVFAGDAATLAEWVHAPVLLTPHEGEFAKLFAGYDWARSEDKCERAMRAAELTGAVVLLKGAGTVIASPDGRQVLHDDAPWWLATAGSGDVLAGLCAGLLAQGMPAFEAAAAAAWLHAQAAWLLGRGMIAEDLPGKIPAVLQAL